MAGWLTMYYLSAVVYILVEQYSKDQTSNVEFLGTKMSCWELSGGEEPA